MNLLLDTHAFLWFIAGDEGLSEKARAEIERIENDRFVSAASLWEIAIKASLGRIELPYPFGDLVTEQMRLNSILRLDITPDHLQTLLSMPFHHRDPFDRLLIAQAKTENLTFVSVDPAADAYEVNRLW